MRIGIITHNYPANSKERKDAGIFLYDFAQELSKKHDVFVLCPDFKGEKEKYKKVKVTWFDWKSDGRKLGDLKITNISSIIQFFRLMINGRQATINFINDNKIDYVLAAWAFPSGSFAHYANKKLKVPFGIWCLGSDINKYANLPVLGRLIRNALRECRDLFANSYALLTKINNLINRKGSFLPAITAISMTPRKNKVKAKESVTFLFLGRLERVKGPDILLEAAKHLSVVSHKWLLKIAGDGSLENDLRTFVKDNGLESKVDFLGRLDEVGVRKAMNSADYLVVPSRSESLPLVLIEASRAGLPVIVMDVGDCKLMVNKYKVGFVVEENTPFELFKSMRKALKTNDTRIFSPGMKKLSRDFNLDTAIQILQKHVKKK